MIITEPPDGSSSIVAPIGGARVGLGTSSLHHLWGLRQRLSLLEHAYDAGVRYFDTAPLYGHESAERVLGKFIRSHQSEGIVAATKVGLVPNPLVTRVPGLLLPYVALRKATTGLNLISPSAWEPRRDFSAGYLVRRVERSLRSMGLDYLDIVYLHDPRIDELGDFDSLFEAVARLRDRGLVRAFGVSASYDVARWLKKAVPYLATVLQVEVPERFDTEVLEWFRSNAAVTFGHFRVFRNVRTEISKEAYLRYVVERAVELNARGTILFSSINPSHIVEFISEVEASDRQRLGARRVR